LLWICRKPYSTVSICCGFAVDLSYSFSICCGQVESYTPLIRFAVYKLGLYISRIISGNWANPIYADSVLAGINTAMLTNNTEKALLNKLNSTLQILVGQKLIIICILSYCHNYLS
jgi:hypothetical protein